jgi:ATP-dependent helicase/nuclease subunit A
LAKPFELTSADANLTVRAAAGTGKTWLLTSRIITLLMQGVAPGAILAITFTRKAAAEIHQRVGQRLLTMAVADERELAHELKTLGIKANTRNLRQARSLFELLLCAEHELRATTFHAFCQDILRRFSLEAEVPPGFELLESSTELEYQSWQALDREATLHPGSDIARALETLLDDCGGVNNTRQALNEFLRHRSDWWAYTESEREPITYAEGRLRQTLAIDNILEHDAFAGSESLVGLLTRYGKLLSRTSPKVSPALAELQRRCQDNDDAEALRMMALNIVFTTQGRRRQLRRSSALVTALGADGADELLALHDTFAAHLERWREQRRRIATLRTTSAWYRCGQRLLEHYQLLKAQQQIVDFADLEWKTYRLLNRSQHAEWVQYKLDQRIDHLLIDEFQDTNPTQWRLLLPLLTEMASIGAPRRRSVFIVGDDKQSIYGFRRADPGLFNVAQDWLVTHMQATAKTQDKSWRSSAAIIEFINLVYGDSNGSKEASREFVLPNFRRHQTHHRQRWGRVELLPLIRRPMPDPVCIDGLRDPLLQPRPVLEDQRYRAEGELVTAHVRRLIGQPIDDDGVRPLEYGDVMILLRDRTHAPAYEAALRRAGIPYMGAGRGTFMQSLEVQDIIHLLRCLIAHYDDLALASALRSPIFACSNDDLALLAQFKGACPWQQRLAQIVDKLPKDHPLIRAHCLLERWSAVADRIPTHDLLDKIYAEGNVRARYASAAPPHLRNRVQINLRRLLELALEVDHGRYPSLSRFITRVPLLADEERHTLSDNTGSQRGYVRLMTIHAAKGLEKPVVFIVDAMRDYRRRGTGLQALVDWPVEAARPQHFQLVSRRSELDAVSTARLKIQDDAVRREEANLLYVALTRAKHALYISACEPYRPTPRAWYAFLENRVRCAIKSSGRPMTGLTVRSGNDEQGNGIVLERGARSVLPSSAPTAAARSMPEIDPRLAQPLSTANTSTLIYPSHLVADDDFAPEGAEQTSVETDSKTRGVAIHRMLELLTGGLDRAGAETKAKDEFSTLLPATRLASCWREACAVVDDPALQPLFDSTHYRQAYNELPILYCQDGLQVFGMIDRLIRRDGELVLIDYKTHARTDIQHIDGLASTFIRQLRAYVAGVRRLWPGVPVRTLLLFTAVRTVIDMSAQMDLGDDRDS